MFINVVDDHSYTLTNLSSNIHVMYQVIHLILMKLIINNDIWWSRKI